MLFQLVTELRFVVVVPGGCGAGATAQARLCSQGLHWGQAWADPASPPAPGDRVAQEGVQSQFVTLMRPEALSGDRSPSQAGQRV